MARILLIEDNDDLRTMLRATLADAGHAVIEAPNGQEGLNLFRQAGADLVLTDIVMPEKEGLAVVMETPKRAAAREGRRDLRGRRAWGGLSRHRPAPGRGEGATEAVSTAALLAAVDELLPGGA